jgi:hypothetical protein
MGFQGEIGPTASSRLYVLCNLSTLHNSFISMFFSSKEYFDVPPTLRKFEHVAS